ncbi:MAG: MoxR family ATPase [Bacteroidota bacterium]
MQHSPLLQQLDEALQHQGYIAESSILTSIYLARQLQRPLLVEGPPGVGKTEIAKVLSKIQETELIRLQCYEGLGAEQAIYDWNYQRQLLALKMMERETLSLEEKENFIFDEKFLLKRPLLKAISQEKSPGLLIDEVDLADEEIDSF